MHLPPDFKVFITTGEPFEHHVRFKTDSATGYANPWAQFQNRIGIYDKGDGVTRFLRLLEVDVTAAGDGEGNLEMIGTLRFQSSPPLITSPELVEWDKVFQMTA